MSGSAPAAYPLAWPTGWPRTPANKRTKGSFVTSRLYTGAEGARRTSELTVAIALDRLQSQLDLLRAQYCVVSSNVELRLDGRPRSGEREPADPGVCVYFRLKGQPTTLPCDRFRRVADNIAAIAAHIDALRRIERYGVGTTAQMFSGFQAIRGPGPRPWREVLGVLADFPADVERIKARRAELAKRHHPDAGDDSGQMAEINRAADEAMEEARYG